MPGGRAGAIPAAATVKPPPKKVKQLTPEELERLRKLREAQARRQQELNPTEGSFQEFKAKPVP
jgi:hypothetical protein